MILWCGAQRVQMPPNKDWAEDRVREGYATLNK